MTLADRLKSQFACVLPGGQLFRCLGVERTAWQRFASHWDELKPDSYAAERGTTRLRRYGHFHFTPVDRRFELLPHDGFAQPENSNPLYLERERFFEPLTERFLDDAVLRGLLKLLGGVATALDDTAEWSAKVTPFRVLASADGQGDPTPEGLHRDGVTLVTSLLVGRDNAVGGESSVYDFAGERLLATTLSEPGTMLLGDDRTTVHGVTPIRPLDPARPARRDVLVTTFAPYQR
jgi:hypothetical protein